MTDYEIAMVAALERMASAWEQMATPPVQTEEQQEVEALNSQVIKKQLQRELSEPDELEKEQRALDNMMNNLYKRRELKQMIEEGILEDTPENRAIVAGTAKVSDVGRV